MKFKDIKQFPYCNYKIDLPWNVLKENISHYTQKYNLNLNPDFQRDYVWNETQQIKYCEYILKGGASGRDLYFNHPGWMTSFEGEYVIVDGKQRLSAALKFFNNEIKIFDTYYKDYEDRLFTTRAMFTWHIATLKTQKEILEWYLDFNSGGTIHTEEELNKVKTMINNLKGE